MNYLHIVNFNGLQTVEGQNDSFSAASKGYKPYQTMNKSYLVKCNQSVIAITLYFMLILMCDVTHITAGGSQPHGCRGDRHSPNIL